MRTGHETSKIHSLTGGDRNEEKNMQHSVDGRTVDRHNAGTGPGSGGGN